MTMQPRGYPLRARCASQALPASAYFRQLRVQERRKGVQLTTHPFFFPAVERFAMVKRTKQSLANILWKGMVAPKDVVAMRGRKFSMKMRMMSEMNELLCTTIVTSHFCADVSDAFEERIRISGVSLL
jgi:hypothetical protein